MLSEETVLETIKENIIDPEIGINIVDMGLIYGVDIDETRLSTAHSTSHSSWMVLRKSTSTSSGIRVGPLK